jgi:hypothetical protein
MRNKRIFSERPKLPACNYRYILQRREKAVVDRYITFARANDLEILKKIQSKSCRIVDTETGEVFYNGL